MTYPSIFPVFHSPPFLRRLRDRFIPVVKNYLKAVYLFTYFDLRTTVIPVVRASFLPSFVVHTISSYV